METSAGDPPLSVRSTIEGPYAGPSIDAALRPDVQGSQCGLLILSENLDAFAARGLTARQAERCLDLMYYLWQDDLTGRLLAGEVIRAADRGVKVRILLDDINPSSHDSTYLALDSHPNIELRLFNPSLARAGLIGRVVEFMVRGWAATRRMHNKAWIADDTFAVVGGRNIGDAYFDAADTNFRDLDVLLSGRAVRQASAVFDDFWDCPGVAPIASLTSAGVADLKGLRQNLNRLSASSEAAPYMDRIGKHQTVSGLVDSAGGLRWTADVQVISDPPEKAFGKNAERWLMRTILPVIESSREVLEITSPYFIPGANGVSKLGDLVKAGVSVSVLTNSLAATDVAAVHGAYANYRRAVLKSGISLFELQPYGGSTGMSVFGSRGASLHTKAFTVDDRAGFIGSFNFDPRSVSLNTEMGVMFQETGLVAEMRQLFKDETAPGSAYRLSLSQGRLRWDGEVDGHRRRLRKEPDASLRRRLLAAFVGLLPVESQL